MDIEERYAKMVNPDNYRPIYLPVTIDATVMHVTTPSLSAALNLTANQLLWVIDIYSLIMAGLILPMGALGDRIGFKNYYL